MVTLKFFAMLKGMAKTDTLELKVNGPVTVGELKKMAATELPALKEAIQSRSVLVSVNQEFALDDDTVKDGDEVAFLPPFSGG